MGVAPAAEPRFAVCVRNDGYPAALELHKIYRMLPDAQTEAYGLVRIVDESGEGYLYPEEYFRVVALSAAAREELLRASPDRFSVEKSASRTRRLPVRLFRA